MIIDIGASENACRGDVCFIYEYDKSTDNRHSQYDKMFPIKNDSEKIYYSYVDEIYENIRLSEYKNMEILFLHSFEHNYEFFKLIDNLTFYPIKIHIICPNAVKNLADMIDKGHLFSFTIYSLHNLLNYYGFENVKVIELMNKQDLYGYGEM